MIIRISTYIRTVTVKNQFFHPIPKGSELIFPAPFRDGVNREKQFAI